MSSALCGRAPGRATSSLTPWPGRAPRRKRIGPRALALIIGAVLACEADDPENTTVFVADFESVCDGAPCGWVQTDGAASALGWVETIHPGEHGLALGPGDAEIAADLDPPRPAALAFGSLAVTLAARCDDGAAIEVTLVVDQRSGADGGASLLTLRGRGRPGADWASAPTVVTATGPVGAVGPAELVLVIVEKTGSGRCELGELRVDPLGVPRPVADRAC